MNLTEEITWIPVSERLPETQREVFVFSDTRRIKVDNGYYLNGLWRLMDGRRVAPDKQITHWCELPRGPQP